MNWTPTITDDDGIPRKLEAGIHYSLIRVKDFRSESKVVHVFDEVEICHGDNLSKPYGKAFKGDDCWDSKRREAFIKENGDGRSALVSAYRDSSARKTGSFDYVVGWVDCNFYVEAKIDAGSDIPNSQARLNQMERATLLALLILSKGRVSTVRAISFYMQPDIEMRAFPSNSMYLKQNYALKGEPFTLTKELEPILTNLAKQIFDRKHPEAYLACLRLLRAVNRSQLDDGIVDLVICLEALFNESKQPGISMRVAQRLSRITNQKKAERRTTATTVKDAYKTRSELVHGTRRQIGSLEDILDSSKNKNRKTPNNDKLSAIKEKLLVLVCSALLKRYTTYQDLSPEELFKALDDLAI